MTLPALLAGQPAEAVVSIANTGSGTLFIDSGAVSNSAVQLVAPAFPVQVAPGASMPLRLRVTPPAPSVRSRRRLPWTRRKLLLMDVG